MSEIPLNKLASFIEKRNKDLEFSAIVALTWTAGNAKIDVKKSLRNNFILLNKWTEIGVRIKPATKQTKTAEVFHIDQFIAQHETGEDRISGQIKGEFWIPQPDLYRKSKGSKAKRIKKGFRPKRIMNKKIGGYFPFVAKFKNKKKFVAVIEGKEGKKIKRTKTGKVRLSILYYLTEDKIDIKKREWFFIVVKESFKNNYNRNLLNAQKKFVK